MKNFIKLILWKIFFFAILLSSVVSSFSQDLAVGITGQTSLTGWKNPVTLLNQESIQKAVLAIAEEPRSREEVSAMIKDEPFGIDELIDSWVLDERNGKLYINFNLVTEADGPVLKNIRNKHGQILAEEIIKRWDTIESAINKYDLETVPREVLAYILIGAFSLDWDGLGLTVEEGWREVAKQRPNGDVFHVWAEDRPEPDALRGLFWGSHNHTQGDIRLTTFGDHYSVPRNGFPDLAWRLFADFQQTDETFQKTLYPGSAVVARDGALNWVASAMILLRDGPVNTQTLAEKLNRPEDRTKYVMRMLKAVEYVNETENGWVSLIPVLDERDVEMTHTLLLAGREAMLAWGESNIDQVFSDVEGLVAVQQGVDPEVMMTKVWHHIFAGANTALIEEGLLADPYQKTSKLRGFFPAVWDIKNNPDTLVGSGNTTMNY